MTEPEQIRIRDAAIMMQYSEVTIYRLIKRGILPSRGRGATDIVQKAILGHGKANVTQRYQKARGPALRAAMVAVEKMLWDDAIEREKTG